MACSWRSPGTEVNSNWECRVEGEQGWWSCCSLKQVAFLRVSSVSPNYIINAGHHCCGRTSEITHVNLNDEDV